MLVQHKLDFILQLLEKHRTFVPDINLKLTSCLSQCELRWLNTVSLPFFILLSLSLVYVKTLR